MRTTPALNTRPNTLSQNTHTITSETNKSKLIFCMNMPLPDSLQPHLWFCTLLDDHFRSLRKPPEPPPTFSLADDTHLRKLILPETLAQLGSSCLFFFFFILPHWSLFPSHHEVLSVLGLNLALCLFSTHFYLISGLIYTDNSQM